MASRQQPSRRSASGARAPEKKIQKNTASRRSDVIRCENCGEDYSITYKRCPFCDERPGRTGVNGRRVDGGRGPVSPIQVVVLVVSLVVIITAMFIVFTKIGPLLFGHKDPGSSSLSSSQSGSVSGSSSSDPSGSSSSVDVSQPDVPQVPVNSLTLSKIDITLKPNEESQITATVDPAEAVVTWTSSNPDALTVDADGVIKNVNSGTEKVKVTVTAAAGDKTAECTVYCRPGSTGTGTTPSSGENTGNTGATTPSGPVAPNSKGTIVNAGDGLNIRSGPGSSYEKVASAANGAEVTILGEESGWYKIDYGGGKTGYVSKDYVAVK